MSKGDKHGSGLIILYSSTCLAHHYIHVLDYMVYSLMTSFLKFVNGGNVIHDHNSYKENAVNLAHNWYAIWDRDICHYFPDKLDYCFLKYFQNGRMGPSTPFPRKIQDELIFQSSSCPVQGVPSSGHLEGLYHIWSSVSHYTAVLPCYSQLGHEKLFGKSWLPLETHEHSRPR